ncbi:hypothetical protein NC651_037049 [Populus alba x Populus x berolinensis]|nr:hypothetical protein NC651_037049 [Populus alba x Populus x berolinensis]
MDAIRRAPAQSLMEQIRSSFLSILLIASAEAARLLNHLVQPRRFTHRIHCHLRLFMAASP